MSNYDAERAFFKRISEDFEKKRAEFDEDVRPKARNIHGDEARKRCAEREKERYYEKRI